MGREWLYWVGGSRRRTSNQDDQTTSAGCMCAVFQLFDHLPLPLNHQHSLSPFLHQQDYNTTFKGVEAPRNSLEMEEPPAAAAAKQEDNLNFPAGIQIKTRREDFSAECSIDSPGTKTPNLVARLMGLDLLPESSTSPSFSCPNSKPPPTKSKSKSKSKSHLNQTKDTKNRSFYDDDINVGARSLPATPRISSARRSDVVYHHHRLSLQINKDNSNEDFAVSAKTTRPRFPQHQHQQQQDENRSPGHYAKQILKQVKESVTRRVGLDITNTTRDRDRARDRDEIIRRDQNLLLKLSKKNSIAHDTKQSTTSPKLRILDTNNKNKPPLAETATKSPRNSASSDANPSLSNPSKPKNQATTQQHQPPQKEINKIGKRLSPKSCDQAIRNKKDDAFVRSPAANKANLTDKKSKKAPLSSELLHFSGPTILPVKKGPSPPATKLPQKQPQAETRVSDSDALSSKRNTQLSSNTSRSDKIFTVPEYVLPDTTNGSATTTTPAAAADYKCYIHKILKRAGIIDKLTPLTLGKWHTPSHPLDPSIFYYLELFHPAAAAAPSAAVLSRRCNRKLIFQLVDEILVDVLRPHLDYKPWISPADHFGLIDDLCRKIEGFPAADCRVLEDIDFLIEKDLSKAALNGYYEEEGERLVREIEGEIVERLVSETVAVAVAGSEAVDVT